MNQRNGFSLAGRVALGAALGGILWLVALRIGAMNEHTQVEPHVQKTAQESKGVTNETKAGLSSKSIELQVRETHPSKLPMNDGSDPSLEQRRVIRVERVGDLAILQGDIVVGSFEKSSRSRGLVQVVEPEVRYWSEKRIPFFIEPDVAQLAEIESALKKINETETFHWVPALPEDVDAVVFRKGEKHCMSSLGRTGGYQGIWLEPGCRSQQILHELLHAIGLVHEQSRPDRDEYVEVLWNEIEPQYHAQFSKVPESMYAPWAGMGFDFKSILLYDPRSFAIQEGRTTLRALARAEKIEPSSNGLSDEDVAKLKRLSAYLSETY